MVHQRECLSLGLEPRDDQLGVHAELDELERDLSSNGGTLLGSIDLTHAATADSFENAVRPDGFRHVVEQLARSLDGRFVVDVGRPKRWGVRVFGRWFIGLFGHDAVPRERWLLSRSLLLLQSCR